ncbi:SPOR domain-containing protein [Guyparkeria sp. 1SP6A2]|nr:SPOR domain-containing protein [Guyparkeria sp. 1SP6A2]
MAEQTESTWTESRFRQRLVGAAVVVALAVLLLPLWLDGSGIDSLRVQSVPEKPMIEADDEIEIPQPPGETGAPLDQPPENLFPDQTPIEARDAGAPAEQVSEPVEEAAARENPADAGADGDEAAKDGPSSAPTGAVEAERAVETERPAPSATASDESADKTAGTPADSLPQTSKNGEFVVQLGSFSDEQNAQALAKSVESSGFDVSIEPLFSDQGTVWRVRVGPYQSRALANEATERLRQRIGRDGLVMTK